MREPVLNVGTLRLVADFAADMAFAGDNELIVDSDSMTFLSDKCRIKRVQDFPTIPLTHHVNYFASSN